MNQLPHADPEAEADALIGQDLVGRYHIEALLGEGAWGRVYEARHLELGKAVAIKVLKENLASDSDKLNRFYQEARATCNLRHENIASVYDFGKSPQGQPFMVMDYFDGQSLQSLLSACGHLSAERAAPVFVQLAAALQAAHSSGVVHRDIKPSNVFLTDENGIEVVKLLDFGMAAIVNPDGSRVNRLTQTGDTIGTPLYMSPEQCSGLQADERSDIYSLGCLMYECLAGNPPFDSESIFDVMNQHLNQIPKSLQQAAAGHRIPRRLEEIVFRALEKKKSDRYQSADELLSDLRLWANAHGGHRTIDRWPPPRLRQQWRQVASRAGSHKKLLTAIFVITGSLLGAIGFLAYYLIHTSATSTESQTCIYRPPAQSCVSNVNYASCPTAGPLARELVGILDTNYPRICKAFGLPDNVLRRKISILLLSDEQAAPAMVSGDTFEFNVGKFQRGEIHMGVIIWQLSMIMEQFPAPVNSQFSRPAWLRTALADVSRATAVGIRNDPFCAKCAAGQTPLTTSACGGAFLLYVQKKYPDADMLKVVVNALSRGTYSRSLWMKTGKSLDQLWAEFSKQRE